MKLNYTIQFLCSTWKTQGLKTNSVFFPQYKRPVDLIEIEAPHRFLQACGMEEEALNNEIFFKSLPLYSTIYKIVSVQMDVGVRSATAVGIRIPIYTP